MFSRSMTESVDEGSGSQQGARAMSRVTCLIRPVRSGVLCGVMGVYRNPHVGAVGQTGVMFSPGLSERCPRQWLSQTAGEGLVLEQWGRSELILGSWNTKGGVGMPPTGPSRRLSGR